MDVSQLVRAALKVRQVTQARFARSIGVSQGTISKWLSEKQYPNKKQWDSIVRFLRTDPRTSELIQGELQFDNERTTTPSGAGARTITASGYLGAGGAVTSADRGGKARRIRVPQGAPLDTAVVIVTGDWNYPAYRDGDRIFFVRQEQPISEVIGRECIVRIANGRTFVRTLRRGSARNLFNLEAVNAPPMEDQRLEWAMPVRWIERA